MKFLRKNTKFLVDFEIALTHLSAKKMQTFVVSLTVVIGIAAFIFLNSLVVGFNRSSDESFFKSMPHLRIYVEDEVSLPFENPDNKGYTTVITNPKIINTTKKIINPQNLVEKLLEQEYVKTAAPWLNFNIFYNSGNTQISGSCSGVNISEANQLFDIQSTITEGNMNDLKSTPNGILIGIGIAQNLNLKLNDNFTIVSPKGIIKVMKVVGIFKTSNSTIDETKSYVNIASAQQLLAQSADYITDIYIKINNPDDAPKYVSELKTISGYDVEAWQTANEAAQATKKTRMVMMGSISFIVLVVAAFTIYNIVNMNVKQKLLDIAILKAQGFAGKSVIKIFLTEAMVIGIFGTIGGMILGAILINLLSKVYVGGDVGYFPIQLEPKIMIAGLLVGTLVTLIAGYIPARSAAKVDPISILRN